MTDRHRSWRTDIALRFAGLCAGALAYAALARLIGLHPAGPGHWSRGAAGYALATIAFLGASAGAALLTLGRHLFDEIERGERWRTDPRPHADATR